MARHDDIAPPTQYAVTTWSTSFLISELARLVAIRENIGDSTNETLERLLVAEIDRRIPTPK